MQGEIQFIKKQIFGGFNREDVVAYIAKMAKERNEAREACKEATKKLEELTEENEALKLELGNSKKVIEKVEDRKLLQTGVEQQSAQNDEPEADIPKNVIGLKRPKLKPTITPIPKPTPKAKVIRKIRAKS